MATDSTDVRRRSHHHARLNYFDRTRTVHQPRNLGSTVLDLYNLIKTINSIKARTIVEFEEPFAGYLKAEYPDLRKQTALRTRPLIKFLEQFHKAETLDREGRLGYVLDRELNIILTIDEKPYEPKNHKTYFG